MTTNAAVATGLAILALTAGGCSGTDSIIGTAGTPNVSRTSIPFRGPLAGPDVFDSGVSSPEGWFGGRATLAGERSQFGRTSNVSTYCFNPQPIRLVPLTFAIRNGLFLMTGVNGDRVWGTFEFDVNADNPEVSTDVGPFTITGGTGRSRWPRGLGNEGSWRGVQITWALQLSSPSR